LAGVRAGFRAGVEVAEAINGAIGAAGLRAVLPVILCFAGLVVSAAGNITVLATTTATTTQILCL
jgi:hypothetical protein